MLSHAMTTVRDLVAACHMKISDSVKYEPACRTLSLASKVCFDSLDRNPKMRQGSETHKTYVKLTNVKATTLDLNRCENHWSPNKAIQTRRSLEGRSNRFCAKEDMAGQFKFWRTYVRV